MAKLRKYFSEKIVIKDEKPYKRYLRYSPYFEDPLTKENIQKDFTMPLTMKEAVTKEHYAFLEGKLAEYKLEREEEARIAQRKTDVKTTVGVMIKEYFELHKKPPTLDIKERTYNGYIDEIDAWIIPHIGHLQAEDVKPDDIQQIWVAMAAVGREESTKKHILNHLRDFFDNLVENDVRGSSPIKASVKFVPKKPNPNPPSIDEVNAVFARMKEKSKPIAYLAALIAAHSGMRRSEIAGIVTEHWDRTNGIVVNGRFPWRFHFAPPLA